MVIVSREKLSIAIYFLLKLNIVSGHVICIKDMVNNNIEKIKETLYFQWKTEFLFV